MADIDLDDEELPSQVTGSTLRRIVGLMRPYRKWMIGFWLAIALTSGLDAFFTYLNKGIVDQGIMAGNREALVRIVTIYGPLILLQSILVFSFIFLAGVLGERVQYDLRKSMFNQLADLSLAFYSQTSVGRLMARVTSDTGRVSELVTWGLLDITWAVMNITTSRIYMLEIILRSALLVFAMIPVLVT